MFAYAKPVPFNPYNLKDQKWGPALVGVAGPLCQPVTRQFICRVTALIPNHKHPIFYRNYCVFRHHAAGL